MLMPVTLNRRWHVAIPFIAVLVFLGVMASPLQAAPSKTPPASLGPQTLLGDGTPPTAHEFFHQAGSSWKGDIAGFVPGTSYSLVVLGIDVTGVTGPADRYVYFNLQDAETVSSFKHLGIQAHLDSPGAGGGTLLQCYQNFTSEGLSSHGLNPGELTASDFDLRFDFSKPSAGAAWSVTPYFRLSSGSWTPFFGGSFAGTVPFDFLGAKLVVAFDGGADGSVSFDNYYVSGPPSQTYVDDDWAAASAEDAVLFPGDPAYHTFGVDAFADVQAGVNAAVGSTVNVAPGLYEQQVVITTNGLTLQGAGVGSTVIRSPLTLTASFTTSAVNKPVVFVNGATNVTIQDLTVDGFGRGNSNARFCGVAFWNGGGKLENADVIGVRDTPFSGAQHGVAVYAFNNTAGPYAIEVANVTVSDFQKTGMALNGNGNLTVNVHDCTATGAGATTVTAQNGIQLYGTGGTVADCTISDTFYSGPTYTASGLLLIDGPSVTVSGTNPVTNCQTAVYSQNTNSNIGGTNVSGTTTWGAVLYNPSISKASAGAMSGTLPEAAPFGDPGFVKAALPGLQATNTISLHDGCFTGMDAVGSEGIEVYSAGGPLVVSLARLEISDWDLGVAVYGTASTVTANDNSITSNVTAGFDNTGSLATQDAESNWWGAANGPGGVGPGSGDAVLGTGVGFAPWLIVGTDLVAGCGFQPASANQVTPTAPSSCISTVNACVTVPVDIARTTSDAVRGFSVTLSLSPELLLCSGLASITEGTYLSGAGTTNFQVLDNGGGSYTVDCAILGLPCGATAATGNLFNLQVKNSGADGTGTVTVTSVTLRDCSNGPVVATAGPAASVTIDNTVPVAIANLAASQVKASNDGDATTKIALTFTAPGDASVVEVYRAPFGQYPEYDDAGGAVPATPSYPPGAPWALTTVTATGMTDEVAIRDFWYYVAFVKDACGNVSAVSNQTGGTLNYHLGDVSNGLVACVGNDIVDTADISLLGAHYGIPLGPPVDTWACLDVGPTTDFSVDARPTTDNQVQFEDLMMFAINYGQVSKQRPVVVPAQTDELIVLVPETADADGFLDAQLWIRGSGRLQGLSARLEWDPAIVVPAGVTAGALTRALDGVAFSPGAGVVDVALLGVRSQGLAGEGDLATVRFRVIGAGDPRIALAAIDARDATNHRVELSASAQTTPTAAVPRVTSLLGNVPNPFNPTTRIPYTLAASGSVELAVYTVDGRRIRTLFAGEREPGIYDAMWNGTDERGGRVPSGVYYVRLATRDLTLSRAVVLLK